MFKRKRIASTFIPLILDAALSLALPGREASHQVSATRPSIDKLVTELADNHAELSRVLGLSSLDKWQSLSPASETPDPADKLRLFYSTDELMEMVESGAYVKAMARAADINLAVAALARTPDSVSPQDLANVVELNAILFDQACLLQVRDATRKPNTQHNLEPGSDEAPLAKLLRTSHEFEENVDQLKQGASAREAAIRKASERSPQMAFRVSRSMLLNSHFGVTELARIHGLNPAFVQALKKEKLMLQEVGITRVYGREEVDKDASGNYIAAFLFDYGTPKSAVKNVSTAKKPDDRFDSTLEDVIDAAVGHFKLIRGVRMKGPEPAYATRLILPGFHGCKIQQATKESGKYEYTCVLASGPRLTKHLRDEYDALVSRVEESTGVSPDPVNGCFLKFETAPGNNDFDCGSTVSFNTRYGIYVTVDLSGSFGGWSVEITVYDSRD